MTLVDKKHPWRRVVLVTGGAIGALVVISLLVFVFILSPQVDDILTEIDDIMITDRQQETIDAIPAVSSCGTLRAYVAFSQEIIAGDGSTDEGFYGTPYGRRLGEAAGAQLDRLRCGG